MRHSEKQLARAKICTHDFSQLAVAARHFIFSLAAVWLALLSVGFAALVAYSQTAGAKDSPPDSITADASSWYLFLGVHPKCPCTLATVSELERLLCRTSAEIYCSALVYVPGNEVPGDQHNFADTLLVDRLRNLPACEIVLDQDGQSAANLGILTSGSCVLYDGNGVLKFHGGITPSRGHEGDNLGTQAILALLQGEHSEVKSTEVYGCRIIAERGGNNAF